MEIAQGCINIKQYFISALYEQLHVKASAGKEQELNKNTNEFDKRLQSSNGNKKVETRTWFHLGHRRQTNPQNIHNLNPLWSLTKPEIPSNADTFTYRLQI
ncbi:hypothetical protein HUJ04_010632 [Dendroctonus ponderosae]|nr:hypothetical protein HUJ04_010632 [Dendroctonus ponderosae]